MNMVFTYIGLIMYIVLFGFRSRFQALPSEALAAYVVIATACVAVGAFLSYQKNKAADGEDDIWKKFKRK